MSKRDKQTKRLADERDIAMFAVARLNAEADELEDEAWEEGDLETRLSLAWKADARRRKAARILRQIEDLDKALAR